MSRRVEHDGMGALRVRFPFDRRLVDRIKTLPNRRWNAEERYWSVPETDVVLLVDLLVGDDFRFDGATRELYLRFGGAAPLAEPATEHRGPTLPGLFDTEPLTEPDEAAERVTATPGDFSVSQLNEQVRRVIQAAFPSSVWLVGEISGFNKNVHRRHVGFHLVELEQDGRKVSEVAATLFERARKEVEGALAAAGDPFQLEDEVLVRVRVHVELYVPWGSYRVIVEEIDVNFTLGEAARRREEIIRRLTEARLVGVNSALPLPALPLRVGLITSLQSDAYNDVLRTLQESGLAFRVTAHGARVQGHQTEPSVLNALDWFRANADRFDVLLICRGGGSRTDLAWFDSEPLGRAVAAFPLPVVVGIGHEQDHSVLDAVARRAKTPTAAAAFLVETAATSRARIEELGQQILTGAAQTIRDERRRSADRGRRLAFAASRLLQYERQRQLHLQQRTVLGSRALLTSARVALARFSAAVPRAASLLLTRQGVGLDATLRALLGAARRGLAQARSGLAGQSRSIAPRGERLLRLERERFDARERRLRLVDPRRVVERGYSILRLDDGKVLNDAGAAPAGTAVLAELRSGRLCLRSEGPDRKRRQGEN